MNLTKYWGWQAELDRNILETHNLVENEELLQKKILALNVELGELANEWRGFKFWSTKPPAPREKILGEYVDCLHFVFSIGNQIGFKLDSAPIYKVSDVQDTIIDCMGEVNDFYNKKEDYLFRNLLLDLVALGSVLGLKNDEIEAAYLSKNETNHKRQEDGY